MKIDRQLQHAANAWTSAVTEGYYGKAEWSIATLSHGIRYLRASIPPDKADQTGEILEKRLEQAELYTSLIRDAEVIDRAERSIHNLKIMLDEYNCKLDQIRREIEEAEDDPEKLKMISRLKAFRLGMIQVTDLNRTEMEFCEMLDEGVRLNKIVEMLKNNLEQEKDRLNMARNELEARRVRLCMEL